MANIFISYSRKDIDFAKRLTGELQKSKLDYWIDWEGIPPTVDWWKEIEKGIEEADAFVFLISPDSAESKVCEQEIDHAVKNGKRLIPLVIRDTSADEVHPKLKSLNWIFFRETDNFESSITKLLTSIHTDFDWVEVQRRLQVRALEWERSHKENSFLLRGVDLSDAESQLATNSSKEPYPTDLQREYVFESHKAEDSQRRSSIRRRNVIATIGALLLITMVLAITGQLNRFIYRPVDMEDYWITIPSGEFLMGSSDEELEEFIKYCPDCDFSIEQPQHWVDLPEFQIGKYEITNKQYNQCVRSNMCSGNIVPTGLDHPVTNVNWHAANTYCKWVGGRLPTEAEWEKVASWDAKTQTKLTYPWGDNELNESMVNLDISSSPTTPVGTFPNAVSPYGVYDMSGNVWEWVSSLYMPYPYDSNDGRENMSSLESRVLRGGGWDSTFSFRSMLVEFRSTYRHWDLSINANTYIRNYGFRCSRSLP